jgi:hypothetical protein
MKMRNTEAKVQINLNGEIYVSAYNWDTRTDISASGPCISTGKLELFLESFI